jgi:hypothetical protein
MKRSTANRLFVVVFALAVFVVYLSTRDTIRVDGGLSPEERRQIIAGIQEWSAPKLFRHIEIERTSNGTVLARVREPGNHWSVTEFMKVSGTWKKSGWFLLGEGKPTVQN